MLGNCHEFNQNWSRRMSNFELTKQESSKIDFLYEQITGHISTARNNVVNVVNTEQITAYWLIGKDIVEDEQSGSIRAEYGKNVLTYLSKKLTKDFGKGFSVDTLERSRKFYLTYQIAANQKSATVLRKNGLNPQ